MPTTTTEHIPVTEAATRLGVSPWEVVRLIESGQIESVRLVNAASLRDYQEQQ